MTIKKMVITFSPLPLEEYAPIQSVSFTSSENKCIKQRRINTVDFILVFMAGGFVSSFLREAQSTIDRAALTRVSFYKPVSSYAMHLECHVDNILKKYFFILP